LHDVLEDTPYTPQQLARKGFSKEVIQAVQLLTKNKSLSYADNIKNIINSGNKLAMMVKYSDNYMNYNGDKSHWDSERANHSNKKYLASLNMLGDVLGIKKHLGNEESNVTESTDYLEEK
jgi:(p)ppGpp synthase/HD superfamily hydrolase